MVHLMNVYHLYSLPDISKWNFGKETDMDNIFKECPMILSSPFISD